MLRDPCIRVLARSACHNAPLFRPSTTAVYWPVTPRDPGSNPGGGAASPSCIAQSARSESVVRGCLTGSGRCLASSRIGVQLSTAPPSGPSARCAACPLLPRVSSNGKTPVFQTGDGGSIPSARTYGTAQVVEQEYTPVSETGSARTCRFDPGPEHRRQRTTKEWKAKSGWSRRSTANRVAPTTLWFDSSAFRHRSRGARCAAWLGTRTRWVRFPGLRP